MERAYLSISSENVPNASDGELFGQLAKSLPFSLETTQSAAWKYQIHHLHQLAKDLPQAHFFLEFLIPRMGRRADLIVLNSGIIFVVEYKLGARQFDKASLNQVYGYGLDLKNFHEPSHNRRIVPILVATEATAKENQSIYWDSDYWDSDLLGHPICSTPTKLSTNIMNIASSLKHPAPAIDAKSWLAGRYYPTPTIVEAAQALYRGHKVEEIARSEAGAENLTLTAEYVEQTIESAKKNNRKIICFITGVPGSGKTLAGLNLATKRKRTHSDEHAVFLSGNGPLVDVLREALALDAVATAKEAKRTFSKVQEERRAAAFIQNIHHFRDDSLASKFAPIEKVVVFDEAQRAWNIKQTSKFMQQKKGQINFSMSEPEFLLSVMDRHKDWCTIICLVGDGQEINTGEAGINEWLRALERSFPHWQAHVPTSLKHDYQIPDEKKSPNLHLATSIRSFRAEQLSNFVNYVISGKTDAAKQASINLQNYPLHITRKIDIARTWLRHKRRGQERIGMLASSNGARLKPHGIFVKAKIEPSKWFLTPSEDIRSSNALEDAATEFEVQGLELDWTCLCWDANFRRGIYGWEALQFKGTKWLSVNDDDRKSYVANSYRVLMTRARQGMILFIPEGDAEDFTRPPNLYDEIYEYLLECGFSSIEESFDK